ncbi:MAG: ParB N-terminal domain-containing protein [Chloroflexota bacterium]|nr:ParB N-terminal domain-containing protein [Chloroflexota bacterium]
MAPKRASDEIELSLSEIEVDPENVRTTYDKTVLEGLREVLRTQGEYINPPVVFELSPGRYRVKHGSTRVLAAQGVVDRLRVRVRQAPTNERSKVLAQLSENLLQTGLGPMDIGRTLRKMRDEGDLSLGQLVGALKAFGIQRSRAWVLRHIALTELDPAVQDAVASGQLNAFQAEQLKGLASDDQRAWMQRAVSEGLSAETLSRLLGRRMEGQGGSAGLQAEGLLADINERIAEAAARTTQPMPSARSERTSSDSPASGTVTRKWALIPLNVNVEAHANGRGRGSRKLDVLKHLEWSSRVSEVERQLAQEALFFGGHSPEQSVALVERAVTEAADGPEPVLMTLNGLRQLLDRPSQLSQQSALAEFLRIRMRRALAILS